MRISPRLIRVANDTQVWTDSYDREVTEIFALQAEIASRIAAALDITLVDRERRALATRPTGNLEAYQAYLQGMKELYAPGFDRDSFERGVRLFERAVQLDPQFALAHARLSSMHSRLYHYGFDRTEQRVQEAQAAADRALALRPDLAEAYLALGHYYYWGRRDYDRALDALQNALLHAPNLGEVLLNTAYVKRRQGEFGEALEYFERYRVLSPMDPNVFVGLGETYGTLRRYDEAERAYRRAATLPPDDPYPYTELALLHLRGSGDVGAAREALATAPPRSGGEGCRVGFLIDLLGRDYTAARERLDLCADEAFEAGAFYLPTDLYRGLLHRLEDQPDEALAAFGATRPSSTAGAPSNCCRCAATSRPSRNCCGGTRPQRRGDRAARGIPRSLPPVCRLLRRSVASCIPPRLVLAPDPRRIARSPPDTPRIAPEGMPCGSLPRNPPGR